MWIGRIIGILSLLTAATGYSATFTVNSEQDFVDSNPGDGICFAADALPARTCTLRAAVMEAEANGEADTILINPGLVIELSIGGANVDPPNPATGDLDITTEIEILGFSDEPPMDISMLPLIDASNMLARHFHVHEQGFLLIRGLRLTGGSIGFPFGSGGSINFVSGGSGRIENCTFSFNSAFSSGGAIAVRFSGESNVVIEDSHFFRNISSPVSPRTGGAIYISGDSEVTILRSSFSDNRTDSSSGATIAVAQSAALHIENSTLDGLQTTTVPGSGDAYEGIEAFDSANLTILNTTITNFEEHALDLNDLDGDERIRISNSILGSDARSCSSSGNDLDSADVEISRSLFTFPIGCLEYATSTLITGDPDLDSPSFDPAPRLTVSRRPSSPFSNVVDFSPICTESDQLGAPRPVDADLDGVAFCDIGAIELPQPEPFVVNHFVDDLIDETPGDGQCAAINMGGTAVCTLRAAIMEANALDGLQRILFEPSTVPVTLDLPGMGTTGGALEITGPVAIEGNLEAGIPATILQGQMPGERLMLLNAADQTVYLRNLRLTGGDAGIGNRGGAIALLPNNDLVIENSELVDNFADASGGAIAALSADLTVRNSDFEANRSNANGWAIFATFDSRVDIRNSSIRNHLPQGLFDPIDPRSAVEIESNASLLSRNSTFSNNVQSIRAVDPASIEIFSSTFFDHFGTGLDVQLDPFGEFFFRNTIIASSRPAAIDCVFEGEETSGSFSLAGILDSDGSCAAEANAGSFSLTSDPGLLSLTRGPGRVSYHYPPSVDAANPSPVLDVVATSIAPIPRGQLLPGDSPFLDQIGNPRPVDLPEIDNVLGPYDLGSIEAQVFDLLFNDSFETLPFP